MTKKNSYVEKLISFLEGIANNHEIKGYDGFNPKQIEEGKSKYIKFYNNIDKNGENSDISEVQKINQNIFDMKNALEGLNFKNNESLNNKVNQYKDLLNKVSTVMNNTTKENVTSLQQIISDNLPEDEKTEFDKRSKTKNGNFDGLFGQGTIDGLNICLEQLQKEIDRIKSIHEADKEKVKEEPEETVAEKGADVEDQAKNEGVDKTPLKIGDKEYGVMYDNNGLRNQLGLGDNVMIYTTNSNASCRAEQSDENGGSHGEQTFNYVTETGGDKEKEYYVKFPDKPDNIYKVKLDGSGNLCPIATEYDNTIEGLSSEVLIKNNKSCISYLESYLQGINAKIGRNDKLNDYTITSYGRILTIEPMTIAGNWISEDLSTNLKLLNMINFLRSGKNENLKGTAHNLKLQDGNLYVKLNRLGKMGNNNADINKKRGKINLEAFGLNDVQENTLQKFKEYNNHEDWNDNRDKKKDNKKYKKI